MMTKSGTESRNMHRNRGKADTRHWHPLDITSAPTFSTLSFASLRIGSQRHGSNIRGNRTLFTQLRCNNDFTCRAARNPTAVGSNVYKAVDCNRDWTQLQFVSASSKTLPAFTPRHDSSSSSTRKLSAGQCRMDGGQSLPIKWLPRAGAVTSNPTEFR